MFDPYLCMRNQFVCMSLKYVRARRTISCFNIQEILAVNYICDMQSTATVSVKASLLSQLLFFKCPVINVLLDTAFTGMACNFEFSMDVSMQLVGKHRYSCM